MDGRVCMCLSIIQCQFSWEWLTQSYEREIPSKHCFTGFINLKYQFNSFSQLRVNPSVLFENLYLRQIIVVKNRVVHTLGDSKLF